MADQKITLHPKDSLGQIIEDTNVYPKTTIDQVYTSDGSNPFDFDFQRPLTTSNELSLVDRNLSINFASNAFKSAMLNMLYPVGTIYTSTAIGIGNKCPIELTLGGTWVQLKDTFLLAHGDTYTSTESNDSSVYSAEGGSATYTPTVNVAIQSHALTVNEMPLHAHDVRLWTDAGNKGNAKCVVAENSGNYTFTSFVDTVHGWRTNGSSGKWIEGNIQCSGYGYGDLAGNTENMGAGWGHTHGVVVTPQTKSSLPPYLTVYMWKRIS